MRARRPLKFAPRIVVVADDARFGKTKSYVVAELSGADTITDEAADPEILAAIRQKGVQVIVAGERG